MKRTAVYISLPILFIALSLLVEYWLLGDRRIVLTLGGNLNEVLKQSLELERQISQLMTGLGTAVIGGVGYYIRIRGVAKNSNIRRRITFLSVSILASAAVSIFFGQLWMAAIRDQLIHDYIDFSSFSVIWPERLQSALFLSSLIWFAILSLDNEIEDAPKKILVDTVTLSEIREFGSCNVRLD